MSMYDVHVLTFHWGCPRLLLPPPEKSPRQQFPFVWSSTQFRIQSVSTILSCLCLLSRPIEGTQHGAASGIPYPTLHTHIQEYMSTRLLDNLLQLLLTYRLNTPHERSLLQHLIRTKRESSHDDGPRRHRGAISSTGTAARDPNWHPNHGHSTAAAAFSTSSIRLSIHIAPIASSNRVP